MAAIHVMMLILGLAAWNMEGVAGDCCHEVTWYASTAANTLPAFTFVAGRNNPGFPLSWTKCADCTEGTPHCGLSACNSFGCGCNGCLTGVGICYCYDQTCSIQFPVPNQNELVTAQSIIKKADGDQDGRISYEEARAHLGGSDVISDADLQALDLNHDGYFTDNEIDPSV